MINTAATPPAAHFAELVSPAISRVFVSGMRPDERSRDLVREHGGPAVGFMIDLRNPLIAGRPISRTDLENLYRYDDPDALQSTMRRTVEHGLLVEQSDGYRASEVGRTFLQQLFELQGVVLEERWGSMAALVARLNDTLATVLHEARRSAGPAFRVQSPPYEPPNAPTALIMLNRLSTLRYHRSDAHAAAWHAEGMTAAEVAAQPWGSEWTAERIAVEKLTNEFAGRPFTVLDSRQQLQLLADLAAIP